jgi:hypothetical protein
MDRFHYGELNELINQLDGQPLIPPRGLRCHSRLPSIRAALPILSLSLGLRQLHNPWTKCCLDALAWLVSHANLFSVIVVTSHTTTFGVTKTLVTKILVCDMLFLKYKFL